MSLTPKQLLEKYSSGFIGAIFDIDDLDKLLGDLKHPLFEICAHNLYGSGQGKISLPFKSVLKFDKNFGVTESQTTGDCLKKDSLVLGPDFIKKIQDIRVGDRVYAGNGEITTVVSTMVKKSLNPMVKIYTKGGLPLEVTSDHKVLAYRFGEFVNNNTKWKRRYSLGLQNRSNNTQTKSYITFDTRKAELIKASELTEADYLLCPLKIEFDTKIPDDMLLYMGDPELRWMIGLFLGDGHANKTRKTLEWACTTDQPQIEKRLCNILNSLEISWKAYSHCKKKSRKARKVYTHKIEKIYNLFKYYFYNENGEKVLPSWAINDDVIQGLLDSDGNIRKGKNKKQSDRQEFTNTSPSLAHNVRLWAINNGFIPSINSRRRKDKRTGKVNKTAYTISWSINKTSRNLWRDDDYLAMPITKIEFKEGPHEEVYDIEVKHSLHTFISGCGSTISNCTSHGTRNAVDITRSCEIIRGEQESFEVRSATEAIYGARGFAGEGMSVSQAVRYVTNLGGILLRKKYPFGDFTKYNGKLGASWGRNGTPKEVTEEAKKHQVKTGSLITTIEGARDAIANGYALTVGSNVGFESKRDKNGISEEKGSWGHCMCWGGCDDSREIYDETLFLIINSWGNWNSGPKRLYQPDGSFWIRERTARKMLSQNQAFALSNVDGFPLRDIKWTMDEVFS